MPTVAHCLAAHAAVCTACTACRERNDGLYRVITYLVAKMVEELGIALLNSIVFGGWAEVLGGVVVLVFWLSCGGLALLPLRLVTSLRVHACCVHGMAFTLPTQTQPSPIPL